MAESPNPNNSGLLPLTVADLQAAYPKLCKCLNELGALRPESIRSRLEEEPFTAWTERYNLTIDGIYGRGSVGCERFCISHLSAIGQATPPSDAKYYDAVSVRKAYASGVASMRQRILSILEDHAEQLDALSK